MCQHLAQDVVERASVTDPRTDPAPRSRGIRLSRGMDELPRLHGDVIAADQPHIADVGMHALHRDEFETQPRPHASHCVAAWLATVHFVGNERVRSGRAGTYGLGHVSRFHSLHLLLYSTCAAAAASTAAAAATATAVAAAAAVALQQSHAAILANQCRVIARQQS